MAKLIVTTEYEIPDVTGDGKIDLSDIVRVISLITGGKVATKVTFV